MSLDGAQNILQYIAQVMYLKKCPRVFLVIFTPIWRYYTSKRATVSKLKKLGKGLKQGK